MSDTTIDKGWAEPPVMPEAAGPTWVTASDWLSCNQILGPRATVLGADCATGPAATAELDNARHRTMTAQHARMRAKAENEHLVTAKTPFNCTHPETRESLEGTELLPGNVSPRLH